MKTKRLRSALSIALCGFVLAACGSTAPGPAPAASSPATDPGLDSSPERPGGTLVVYFSMPETIKAEGMSEEEENSTVVVDKAVLGNTQYVAQLIQKATGAEMFRIEPKVAYPSDHATLVKLASAEQSKRARPELAKKIEDIGQYDTVFLGYPNWWGDMPMILYTFLEGVDLTGVRVIPFNTHGGSGFSETIGTIAKLQPGANVEPKGLTISRNDVADSAETVTTWLEQLELQ